MEMDKNKMATTPMTKLIISMSLPAMFSMLIQSFYNIIDGIFVAKLNSEAFVAVSLALPVQVLLIAFAVGAGVGINSLISRKLGEQDFETADSAATNGIFISVVLWAIFAIIGATFSRPFLGIFSDNQVVIKYGTDYLSIVTVFCLGVFVQIAIEKILQATGNMVYPMVFQLIGAITNIILDPILIFGLFGFPALGVKGAAIATICGQVIGSTFSIYIMLTKAHDVKINFKNFRPNFKVIKEIFVVGLPAIVMQSIASVLIVGLNKIYSTFSEDAIFVVGTYAKLQGFVFMPVYGLMQGMMPIMGYNYGARNKSRLTSCYKIGSIIAFSIMLVGSVLFFLFPEAFLDIFEASDSAKAIGIPALRIIAFNFPIAALSVVSSTFFQSIGKGYISLIVSVVRQMVVVLPLCYVLAKFIGLGVSWYSFPVAELVGLIVSIIWTLKLYKKDFKVYFSE